MRISDGEAQLNELVEMRAEAENEHYYYGLWIMDRQIKRNQTG